MKKEKIGIIGFGAIGQEVYKKISKKIIKGYSVVGVFSNDIQDKKLSKKIKCTSFEELLKKRPDIIIEAASVDACKDYLEKRINLNELKEKISIKTRQYAKRQSTWARGQMSDWQKIKFDRIKSFIKKFPKSE